MSDNSLTLALIFGSISLIMKYIVIFFTSLFSKEKLSFVRKLDWKEDTFSFTILTSIFFVFFSIYFHFEMPSEYYLTILVSLSFVSIPITYSFLIHPIYFLINSSIYQKSDKYEEWVRNYTTHNVYVRIIDKDVNNAYATGVVPFLKVVLIGKSTINNFTEDEMKSIILHEIGHINLNHLMKLYICNLFYLTFYMLSSYVIFPYFRQYESEHILVGIYGAIVLGGGSQIFMGFIQRRFEKEADSFAAEKIGIKEYQTMLLKLNEVTNGGLEKWAPNYPNLKERLANVEIT